MILRACRLSTDGHYHAYLDQAIIEIAQGLAVPLNEGVGCDELDPMRHARNCSVTSPEAILAGSGN